MVRIQGSRIFKATLAGMFALCAASPIFGETAAPATGLGQSWPNAPDVSTSPNWHVYVFQLNGVKYIQVNDLAGTVHAAVGTANGVTIVLPVGVDAQHVKTAHALPASRAMTLSNVVYRDGAMTIMAVPQSSGGTQFTMAQTCGTAYGCTGGNVVGGP